MIRSRLRIVLRSARILIAALLAACVLAAFLPEIQSDRWWIRYPDFARLQAFIATVALLVAFVASGGLRDRFARLIAALAAVAAAFQAFVLFPYTSFAPPELQQAETCTAERTLRVLSANVQAGNRNDAAMLGAVRQADPDIVLLLETDPWWDERIETLADLYPYRLASEARAARYYGMQLLSRLPLTDPEMLYLFDSATPTLSTGITLADGAVVRFFGLHPRPPLPEPQPTTLRDGSIAATALRAAGSDAPAIMAGDLNAVSWSPIVQLAKRVAGVEDPRIGRGFIASFDAGSSWMRWPIDHILVQDEFSVLSFGRLGDTGSDHFPMVATLCLQTTSDENEEAAITPADRALAENAIEAARSLEPGG